MSNHCIKYYLPKCGYCYVVSGFFFVGLGGPRDYYIETSNSSTVMLETSDMFDVCIWFVM